MASSSDASLIQDLPKAELHVHLEGTLDAAVLSEFDQGITAAEVDRRYRLEDFDQFIAAFKWAVGQLVSADHYALAARRYFEKLAAQNVRYVEITLAVGVVLWKKLDFAAVYDAVARECARAPLDAWLVLDAVRHFGVEHVDEVARLAVERAGDRVVAFGIGGDERLAPPEMFAATFRFVREHGLALVPHAGETTGAASVRSCLELGARRIGHGIHAVTDPALLTDLVQRDVALEVCISSNVATGSVSSLASHPVRRLFDAGVPIVLNTDDPALFGTDLNSEYTLAANQFGFTTAELQQLAANSLRYGIRSTGL
ncbi:MAG: adenosine deaminase [Acidobacteriota bacterium]